MPIFLVAYFICFISYEDQPTFWIFPWHWYSFISSSHHIMPLLFPLLCFGGSSSSYLPLLKSYGPNNYVSGEKWGMDSVSLGNKTNVKRIRRDWVHLEELQRQKCSEWITWGARAPPRSSLWQSRNCRPWSMNARWSRCRLSMHTNRLGTFWLALD